MFDPNAELERFGRHRHGPAGEHLVSVAGAVADGENDHRSFDKPAGSADSPDPLFVELQVFDFRMKADFATMFDDLAANGLYNGGESVATQVGTVIGDNVRLADLLAFWLNLSLAGVSRVVLTRWVRVSAANRHHSRRLDLRDSRGLARGLWPRHEPVAIASSATSADIP